MKRLIANPEIFWITFTRHLGPPKAYAEFNLVPVSRSLSLHSPLSLSYTGPYLPVSASQA